jgi:hypothetical protein
MAEENPEFSCILCNKDELEKQVKKQKARNPYLHITEYNGKIICVPPLVK